MSKTAQKPKQGKSYEVTLTFKYSCCDGGLRKTKKSMREDAVSFFKQIEKSNPNWKYNPKNISISVLPPKSKKPK